MTITRTTRPPTAWARARSDGAYQAFWLLRIGFTIAPIVFGLDKFANVLTSWPGYLAPRIDAVVPGTAQQFMYAAGAVEIAAGILVAVRPRVGGYVVAAWLAGIIANLLLIPGFYDVALRDLGLLLGALALARLASTVDGRTSTVDLTDAAGGATAVNSAASTNTHAST